MAQDEDGYELAARSDSVTAEEHPRPHGTDNMETDGLIDEDMHGRGNDHEQLNRRTLRKLDFILLPYLCLFFLLNSIDKTNLGNAETAGWYF